MIFTFLSSLLTQIQGTSGPAVPPDVVSKMLAKQFYDFEVTTIDGKPLNMKQYKGSVLLIVNVASKCGYTPQYEILQKLYAQYKDKGLIILGFPANNFREQEPGTDKEIKEFCGATYGVTFPLFSKISVKGADMHPIYQWLLSNSDPNQNIEWNFNKFVVSRSGKIQNRFNQKVKPDSQEMVAAIEAALAGK
jgi:glutathione peroxidase